MSAPFLGGNSSSVNVDLFDHYAAFNGASLESIQVAQERRNVVVGKLNDSFDFFSALFGNHPLEKVFFLLFERHADFRHKYPPDRVGDDPLNVHFRCATSFFIQVVNNSAAHREQFEC